MQMDRHFYLLRQKNLKVQIKSANSDKVSKGRKKRKTNDVFNA